MSKKSGIVCAALNCPNKSYNSKLSFFNFPKDSSRAQAWLTACGRLDLVDKIKNYRNYKLCAVHFEDRMFTGPFKTRLLEIAIPTLSLSSKITKTDIYKEHNYVLNMENLDISSTPNEPPRPTVETNIDPLPTSAPPLTYTPTFLLAFPTIVNGTSQAIIKSAINLPSTSSKASTLSLSSSSTQTEAILASGAPMVLKLRKTIKKLRNQIYSLKKKNKKLEEKSKNNENVATNITLQDYLNSTHKFCPSKGLAKLINTQIVLVQKRHCNK